MSGDGARPIIAVIGATGSQGGGLARAILGDPERPFMLRAITRSAESEPAQALLERGAEVVTADLDEPDSLVEAFRGAHGAFCVTNFWEHFSPAKELSQAANLAEAARVSDVEHVIWSTLEDTRKRVPLDDDRMPTLMGNYKVPHFDAKGASDQAFRDRRLPTTFLRTSFYWENFIDLGAGPQRGADGTLALSLPLGNAKLPGICRDDIGGCAYGIFKAGAKYIGRTIGVAGEHLTGPEMAAALSAALATEVRFNDVPPDVYRTFDFPGAADLANMYQYQNDFNEEFCAVRNVDEARALHPELLTFAAWLEAHKELIPL